MIAGEDCGARMDARRRVLALPDRHPAARSLRAGRARPPASSAAPRARRPLRRAARSGPGNRPMIARISASVVGGCFSAMPDLRQPADFPALPVPRQAKSRALAAIDGGSGKNLAMSALTDGWREEFLVALTFLTRLPLRARVAAPPAASLAGAVLGVSAGRAWWSGSSGGIVYLIALALRSAGDRRGAHRGRRDRLGHRRAARGRAGRHRRRLRRRRHARRQACHHARQPHRRLRRAGAGVQRRLARRGAEPDRRRLAAFLARSSPAMRWRAACCRWRCGCSSRRGPTAWARRRGSRSRAWR